MQILMVGQKHNRIYCHDLFNDIRNSHVDYIDDINDATQTLKDKAYDLILLDYNIPVTNLIEIIEESSLSELNNNTSLMILTHEKNQPIDIRIKELNKNINYACTRELDVLLKLSYQMSIESFINHREVFNILIIDDSIDDYELYFRLLNRIFKNCTINHCVDAEQAIKEIKHNKYSLILLDYNLCGMNGIEFLSKIAPLKEEIPIIALTGSGNEEVAINFMKMGAGDYITKSKISYEVLSESILTVLKRFNSNKVEKEKQNELSFFAYNIIHDIKGPLGRINSYAQLISKKNPDIEPKYIQNIIEDSEYIDNFLNDLLIYSEVGRSNKALSEVDLNDVLKQSISNLEIEVKNKDAEIKIENMPKVLGHSISLIQLFQNLISNAIKYCIKKPIIRISSKIKNNLLYIKLSDNGIGISIDSAKNIFKPFTRINNHLNASGTGIGLSICSTIIKQHHAEIDTKPNNEGGTDFIITIPYYRFKS